MPKRYSSRQSTDWRKIGGGILIAVVVLVLLYGIYWYDVTRRAHVTLNSETYCPEGGPRAVTAVIVDTTDALNVVQRTHLMHEIEELIAAIPRYGALEIYAVGPVKEEPPQPIFLKCNPGRAAEISEWTGNPKRVERDWREGFRKPLDGVLNTVLESNGDDNSPILESIQWVTINALTSPGRSESPRRLVVVSDFLQNTAGLSHYRGVPAFATFAKTPYYRKILAPLQGVSVELLRVRRYTSEEIQEQPLTRFWIEYFDAQGVRDLRFLNLAG